MAVFTLALYVGRKTSDLTLQSRSALAEDIGFKVSGFSGASQAEMRPIGAFEPREQITTKSTLLRKKINSMNLTSAPDGAILQQVREGLLQSTPIGALDAHD